MDLKVIADGLAARFANVTATNGSETETATATADLPDTIATLALLVYPPLDADLDIDLGPKLDDHYLFTVRLLRDPLSMPARTRWLYAWATALRTKVQQDMDLGVAGVAWARATRMRVQIAGQPYSNVTGQFPNFDVVELTVDVHVYEITTIGI